MRQPKRTVDIRRINRETLLRRLFFEGPASRIDLSQSTHMSTATVSNVIADLLRDGVIEETGSLQSEGGRPATLLAVNGSYGYMVGIDLGETHVQLELFDLTLKQHGAAQRALTPDGTGPEDYAGLIARGFDELLAQAQLPANRILGVGVGVPGVVERNHGVSVSAPLWHWEPIAFQKMLEDRLPCPVYLDNGAKAMTLAESWFGAGRGVEDLVVILIGTGIGAGVIAEGKLYRGAANSAGEWGHSKIILDGRPCRCNSAGCLEAYAGAPGIVTTLRETRPDSPLLAQRDQFSFIESLSQAASRSDPAAQATLEATARYLGVGIANIVNLFNPHKILIGGWVGLQLGRQLLHGIETFVREHALPPAYRSVSIDLCHLGADAVPMGAACLVLETFLNAQSQG